MQLFPIDNRREVLIAENEHAAIVFATLRFISIAERSIAEHKSFSVALSGGSTPKKLYEHFLIPENAARVNWSRTNLFWSDERAVPPNSPQSNFGMAMESFGKPPLNQAHTYRMPAEQKDEKSLQKASHEYEELIRKHCFEERFDLVLLGIGNDCHTASLFPETLALKAEGSLVTPSFFPEKQSWRMSLTFPCINEARKIIVLAFGKAKGQALQKIFFGKWDPQKYPAQMIGRGTAPALFIIDEEAALELKPNESIQTEEAMF